MLCLLHCTIFENDLWGELIDALSPVWLARVKSGGLPSVREQ